MHNVLSTACLPIVTSKVLQGLLTEQMLDPLDIGHPGTTDQAVDFICQDIAFQLPICVSEQLWTPDEMSNGAHQISQALRKEQDRAYNRQAQRRRRSKKQVRCLQGSAARFELTRLHVCSQIHLNLFRHSCKD